MRNNNATLALAVFMLAVVAGTTSLRAQDALPQTRLGEIKQQINEARDAIDKLNNDKSATDDAAADLSVNLVTMARKVQEIEDQNNKINRLLAELDNTIADREQALNEQDEDMQETLAALTRVGRRPEAVNLASPAPLIQKVRAAAVMRHAIPKIEEKATRLATDLTALSQQKAAQQEAREGLTKSRAVLDTKRTKLAKMLDRKQSESNKISSDLAATQKRVAALEGQARDLEDLLQRIEADRLRKEQQIATARAAGKPTAARPHLRSKPPAPARRPHLLSINMPADRTADRTATQTANGPRAELTYTGNFTAQKGQLRLPARGRVVTNFGSRTHRTAAAEQGTTFKVATGAQIIASAAGKVVYAGPFRSLGGLVIINVGQGYHMLIAGLSQIDVTVGQTLLAGEPIGIVMPQSRQNDWQHSTSTETNPTIYVEIRQDGKPVNPARWFSTQDRRYAGLS